MIYPGDRRHLGRALYEKFSSSILIYAFSVSVSTEWYEGTIEFPSWIKHTRQHHL